jgi:NADH-quinone oxidoreductase subunit K
MMTQAPVLVDAVNKSGPGMTPYLVVAAMLFSIGMIGMLTRRNILVMFMCVELMLNAVNLTFVTFARKMNDVNGEALVFFVLVVAAAEVVVGLGIIVSIVRRRQSATADSAAMLKG